MAKDTGPSYPAMYVWQARDASRKPLCIRCIFGNELCQLMQRHRSRRARLHIEVRRAASHVCNIADVLSP